jgi:mono/diheme cytochrome c family protein
LADEDLVAVVSFLRSRPAVRNEVPEAQYTAFGKTIRTIAPAFRPQFVTVPASAPAAEATAARGEYLARYVANCVGCHTNRDRRTGDAIGPEFAGGFEFRVEPGAPGEQEGLAFRSANLTPDPTGVLRQIGSADAWIKRFHAGRVHKGSPMPWGSFARMSDADLEALWIYFNGLPAVSNPVVTVFRDTARTD